MSAVIVTDKEAPCAIAFTATEFGRFGPECGEPGNVVYIDPGRMRTALCPRHQVGTALRQVVEDNARRERNAEVRAKQQRLRRPSWYDSTDNRTPRWPASPVSTSEEETP